MLELKLQYFGHLMHRTDSLEKTLMLGKIQGRRRRGRQRMRWLEWHHRLMMSLSNLRELVMDREAWCPAVHEVAKSWTWLSDWIELSYLGPAYLKKTYSVLSHPEFPQGSLTRQLYYDSFTTTTSFVYWCGRQQFSLTKSSIRECLVLINEAEWRETERIFTSNNSCPRFSFLQKITVQMDFT